MRSLKQTLETKLNGRVDKLKEAEAFLIDRENKLSNSQSNRSASEKTPDPFVRGNKIRLLNYYMYLKNICIYYPFQVHNYLYFIR